MKQIYLVYGGNSVEHDISILSALIVFQRCKSNKNEYHLCYLDKSGTFYVGEGLKKVTNYEKKVKMVPAVFFSKNGKGWIKAKKKRPVDGVILLTHGFHTEDGTVGAFFETLQIPVCYSGVEVSSWIQNKALTKSLAQALSINVVQGKLLSLGEMEQPFSYPVIVKPNHLGSSIGVKKVENQEELQEALSVIYALQDDALVEQCIHPLKELNIALMITSKKQYISEIEMTNQEEAVLDYEEKYAIFSRQKEKEIPARITYEIKERIIAQSVAFYTKYHLKGIVRFDYFLSGEQLLLNEVNLIPGSLAYYLFEQKGISMSELVEVMVEEAEKMEGTWSRLRSFQSELELRKLSGK